VRDPVKIDLASLASGAVLAALGALVLLDSSDTIDLSLGWAAAALAGAVGVMLLLSGLLENGSDRHD
jgi:hypothetical protein